MTAYRRLKTVRVIHQEDRSPDGGLPDHGSQKLASGCIGELLRAELWKPEKRLGLIQKDEIGTHLRSFASR